MHCEVRSDTGFLGPSARLRGSMHDIQQYSSFMAAQELAFAPPNASLRAPAFLANSLCRWPEIFIRRFSEPGISSVLPGLQPTLEARCGWPVRTASTVCCLYSLKVILELPSSKVAVLRGKYMRPNQARTKPGKLGMATCQSGGTVGEVYKDVSPLGG